MIKCSNDCIPCCDFCIHAIQEKMPWDKDVATGGPIGCKLHVDKEHQDIAESCGCCEDFHCFLAKNE